MNIHQLNVSYVNEQDRLLLRINTHTGQELSLWFTRRLTLSLLPALKALAADQMKRHTAQASPATSLHAQRQHALESFQKEAAAYRGDYSTPFQEQTGPGAPARRGAQPLLVSEVKLSLRAAGQLQFQLFEKLHGQTRHVQLVMEPPLTQGLLQLLQQALRKSQWLELPPSAAGPETAEGPDPEAPLGDDADRPKYLN